MRLAGYILIFLLIVPFVFPFMETGLINTDGGWITVNLKSSYTNPIVIAYPREGAEIDMDHEVATAIVTNITATSFRTQLRNETVVLNGNVSYIVVENGTHTLSNGMLLQAGRVEPITFYDAAGQSASSWYTVTYHQAYAIAPSVVISPQNESANDWLSTRYDTGTYTTTSIDVSLERDQAAGTAPLAAAPSNSIGWIALNRTSAVDMEGALEVSVTEDPGSADWQTLVFSNTYTTPLFFALGEQDGGSDPTTIGIQNLAATGVDVRHTEDRQQDSEQNHATEDVLWMVFEEGLGNVPPTAPTNISCDNMDCNFTVSSQIIIMNASGANDSDGNLITYYIEMALLDSVISSDQESTSELFQAIGGNTIIGEAGEVNISGFQWSTINFTNSYTTTPYVIGTPASDNNNSNNAIMATISEVTTTDMNITICQDAGATTCDTGVGEETFHYAVFDPDELDQYDWIDGGTVSALTGGGNTVIPFSASFANTPYVFSSPQTYIGGSAMAAHAWAHSTTTAQTTLIACDHPGTADACAGSSTETFAWIAVDPVAQIIDQSDSGTQSISNSAWTNVVFNHTYVDPAMMVLQNSDAGAQDPQYPWARNVATTNADIRYCEQDAAGVCHSHAAEDVRWMALEQGDIVVVNPSDVNANQSFVDYTETQSSEFKNITFLSVTVQVSVYDDSGSTANGNVEPDLEVYAYNGATYVYMGNMSLNQTGNYTMNLTDPAIMVAWRNQSNTHVRFRAVMLDYFNSTDIDSVGWDGVWTYAEGLEWTAIGNHLDNETLRFNITDIPEQLCIDMRARAIDHGGSDVYSDWYVKNSCLNVTQGRPTVPTDILCDGDTNCTLSSNAYITLNGINSTDPENETITYFFQALLDDVSTTPDAESGVQSFVGEGGPSTLGEAGEINLSRFQPGIVQFTNNFSTTPIIIATPVTYNNATENAFAPVINSRNRTHMNISLCQDTGSLFCNTSVLEETVHWMAWDPAEDDDFSWIQVGTVAGVTNGGDTAVSFSPSFANAPYVHTQVQTDNDGGSFMAPTTWTDDAFVGSINILGCEHPGVGDTCGAGTLETFGYVAIDPVTQNFDIWRNGTEFIADSTWTGVTWSALLDPIMMVTQNDDLGGQDPQYPWARSVTTTSADIRYCEQDGLNVCNTHTDEDVRWAATEQGLITAYEPANDDTESSKEWVTYYNISESTFISLDELTILVNVSVFSNAGSAANGNLDPAIELAVWDGSQFVNIGNFSVSGTGQFSLDVIDSGILTTWGNETFTHLRLRAVNIDYHNDTAFDTIAWEAVTAEMTGNGWLFIGTHVHGGELKWDVSRIDELNDCIDLRVRAKDIDGSGIFSAFYQENACIDIIHSECQYVLLEPGPEYQAGYISKGDKYRFECQLPYPVRPREEIKIRMQWLEAQATKILTTPRILVGARKVLFP